MVGFPGFFWLNLFFKKAQPFGLSLFWVKSFGFSVINCNKISAEDETEIGLSLGWVFFGGFSQ